MIEALPEFEAPANGQLTGDKIRYFLEQGVFGSDRPCHYPADNWLQRSAGLPLRGVA